MDNKYTVADMFAGAGGLSKAFQKAGAEIVWANEFDRKACNLYRENFSEVCLVERDIKEVEAESIPSVDILVGGFSGQSFSFGGQRSFFDNIRENLFFEILRILKVKKSRTFLIESLKLVESQENGDMFKMIFKSLQDEGYYIKYIVLNSKEYGNIPHNKQRMYIVGFRDSKEYDMFEFPEKIQLTMKINDVIDVTKMKDKKYYNGESIEILEKIKGEEVIKGNIYQLRRNHRNNEERYVVAEYNVCPALTSYIKNKQYVPLIKDDFGIRMLMPSECFNFQGFLDIKIPSQMNDTELYKYAGVCSSVTVVKRIAENILKSLDSNIQSSMLENILTNDIKNSDYEIKLDIISQSVIEDGIKQEKSVKNEEEFTIQKVIPALKRKDFFDVRYNHGSDEYGKDVTYKYNDNFHSVKYGAVQVKYGDVSGNANGTIDVILAQIHDAFEIPHIDIIEGRENYIRQLLIVCSGRYTKNAKDKILRKVKKGYDVRFFDGQDIDNLLGE